MVLVHDGARPLVTQAMIETSVTATVTKKATTMAVPVKDTITIIDKKTGTISRTPERDSLYTIQTPQTFDRELLLRAHRAAAADGFAGTDDASLVERLGIPVTVLMGSYTNIKITTPEDLLIAEAFMQGGAL
jgi:2-C-methyl-D-erythritol 4-phosphate cytidylyltransferase